MPVVNALPGLPAAAPGLRGKALAVLHEVESLFIGREPEVRMSMLALLSKSHACFLGDPGVAKTAVVAQIMRRLTGTKFYEAQVYGDTPATDVFGQYSLKALDLHDKHIRNIEGFLPTADVGYLGEIFQATGSLLVGLNSILQEHKFRNGADLVSCAQLISLFSSSNFYPEDRELQSLWDRFLLRRNVAPLTDSNQLQALLQAPDPDSFQVTATLSLEELAKAHTEVARIAIPPSIAKVMSEMVVSRLMSQTPPIVVSNRRLRAALWPLRAAAYLRGSPTVGKHDFYVLRDILWQQPDDIAQVNEVISEHEVVTASVVETIMAETRGLAARLGELKATGKALADWGGVMVEAVSKASVAAQQLAAARSRASEPDEVAALDEAQAEAMAYVAEWKGMAQAVVAKKAGGK